MFKSIAGLAAKASLRAVMCLFALLGPTAAFADGTIEAIPTAWRLQTYTGSNMYVYYTGSPCAAGSLLLGASVSADDKNRFWSLVLTAKSTGKSIGITYETTTGVCNITSFYTAN